MDPSKHTYVAIMAGGIGSRFWPASREDRPKQFLDILGVGKSLLRLTFERFLRLTPAGRIFVVTNAQYQPLVQEQLPELGPGQILCEPSRNNTAPCVAYTAFKLQAIDPAANFVVAPSDHLILDEAAFLDRIREALAFTAGNDALVTLGIQPTRPDTGYGYIRYEKSEVGNRKSEVRSGPIHKVLEFTEKPPLERARQFVASGEYLWNAGIFVWRAGAVLDAFRAHARAIYDILGAGSAYFNTPGEQAFIDEAYPMTPNISVDYAIMERADNVYTIPSAFGWSDLGTWASLHEVAEKNADGNVIQGGRVLATDTHNCLLRLPEGKLLVCRNLDNFILVDEGDILLLWPKDREQEIKGVVERLKKEL